MKSVPSQATVTFVHGYFCAARNGARIKIFAQ